jgi:hypothetical protein
MNMAFMGCWTRDQRTQIEARAREIMKKLLGRASSCNCYHPQDTGSSDHAPDCARILSWDAAWDHAVERAADELGF